MNLKPCDSWFSLNKPRWMRNAGQVITSIVVSFSGRMRQIFSGFSGGLLRQRSKNQMPEHEYLRNPDYFCWNEPEVVQPVVIRAQHSHVIQRVCPTVFPGHDVRHVAGAVIPSAQRAPVMELAARDRPECVRAGVSAVAWPPAGHLQRVQYTPAFVRACFGVRPDRRVVAELPAATGCCAGSREPGSCVVRGVHRVPLPGKPARLTTEHRFITSFLAIPPGDRSITLPAGLARDVPGHGLSIDQKGV